MGGLSSLFSNHWGTDSVSFCNNFNQTIIQRDSKSRERKLLSSQAYQDKCWQGHKSHCLKSAVLGLAQSSYDWLCLKVLNKMSNHCHGHCHHLCHHPGSSVFPGLSLHREHGVIPANTYWRGPEKGEGKNYFKICKRNSIVLSKDLLHWASDAAVLSWLHCIFVPAHNLSAPLSTYLLMHCCAPMDGFWKHGLVHQLWSLLFPFLAKLSTSLKWMQSHMHLDIPAEHTTYC